jgi:hypothetical protein
MINATYKPKKFGQYDDVIPHIIKGFFSDDEIKEVKGLIDHGRSLIPGGFYSPLVLPKLAREQIELKVSGKLLKKIEYFASDFVGEDVAMTHNSYLSYNTKHSEDSSVTPNLPPHFDSDNYFTKLTIDYQLDANISWPIVIDTNGELHRFDMEYGDLLVFWGAGTIHWRDPIVLKEGDNCEVWTAHFAVQKDFDELNIPARDPEARKRRMKEWEEKSKYSERQTEWQDKFDLLKNKHTGLLKIKELNKKLQNAQDSKIVERNNNVG